MRILVVNPNTTVSMTEKVGRAARAVARSDTEIIATNPAHGPSSIQGYLDVATCIPGLLEEVGRHPVVDAIVIACFDDTGCQSRSKMGQRTGGIVPSSRGLAGALARVPLECPH